MGIESKAPTGSYPMSEDIRPPGVKIRDNVHEDLRLKPDDAISVILKDSSHTTGFFRRLTGAVLYLSTEKGGQEKPISASEIATEDDPRVRDYKIYKRKI